MDSVIRNNLLDKVFEIETKYKESASDDVAVQEKKEAVTTLITTTLAETKWHVSGFTLPYAVGANTIDELDTRTKQLFVELPAYRNKHLLNGRLRLAGTILLIIVGIAAGIIAAAYTFMAVAVVSMPFIFAAALVLGAFLLPAGVISGIGRGLMICEEHKLDHPKPLTQAQCEALLKRYEPKLNSIDSESNKKFINDIIKKQKTILERTKRDIRRTINGLQREFQQWIMDEPKREALQRKFEQWKKDHAALWDAEVAATYAKSSCK